MFSSFTVLHLRRSVSVQALWKKHLTSEFLKSLFLLSLSASLLCTSCKVTFSLLASEPDIIGVDWENLQLLMENKSRKNKSGGRSRLFGGLWVMHMLDGYFDPLLRRRMHLCCVAPGHSCSCHFPGLRENDLRRVVLVQRQWAAALSFHFLTSQINPLYFLLNAFYYILCSDFFFFGCRHLVRVLSLSSRLAGLAVRFVAWQFENAIGHVFRVLRVILNGEREEACAHNESKGWGNRRVAEEVNSCCIDINSGRLET